MAGASLKFTQNPLAHRLYAGRIPSLWIGFNGRRAVMSEGHEGFGFLRLHEEFALHAGKTPGPVGVGRSSRVVLWKSFMPRRFSNRLIRLQTHCGESCSSRAAADMLLVATTRSKISISSIWIASVSSWLFRFALPVLLHALVHPGSFRAARDHT